MIADVSDYPFPEVGFADLAVTHADLLAVAGARDQRAGRTPVAAYDLADLRCRGVIRSRHPVRALAIHPTSPLVAVGTGRYDGGYAFVGELILWDLDADTMTSLFAREPGRQVLALDWNDNHDLLVRTSPPDESDGPDARGMSYSATVRRPDWRAVPPGSIEPDELTGPRLPAPRSPGAKPARELLASLARNRSR